MTVRLQKPYRDRGVGAVYTGADEAFAVAVGSASLFATTGAGTGSAAATPAVRLSKPYGGQGVGTLYMGSDGAAVVAAGAGYYEGTVGAGSGGLVAMFLRPLFFITPFFGS